MARKSQSRFRLGAVLVNRRQVLGVGFNNMRKTHPRMAALNNDPTWTPGLHAEVHACLGISEHLLVGATLYVARLTRGNRLALARPCEMCERFLVGAGIGEVWFSTGVNWLQMEL